MNLRQHGGTKEITYDFSVNLNPLIDEKIIKSLLCNMAKHAIKYPEERGERLVKVIAERIDIKPENIILGNGSIELFYYLPQILKPKRIFTLEPTFCEYSYICEINGIPLKRVAPQSEFNWDFTAIKSLLRKGDLIFICNPNNPTGTLFKKEDILEVVERGAFVVVDEAFMDFCVDNQSMIEFVENCSNVIVVKSLTKIYSLAGLRIGFLVADKEIVSKFGNTLPLWNVNGVAQEIARAMICDDKLIEKTKSYVSKERQYLEKKLSFIKELKVYKSEANFLLCRTKRAKELQEFALKEGVHIRDNKGFYGLSEDFFRVAVKKSRENLVLVRTFKKFFLEGESGI